jgi:hypothetical protein
MKRITLFSTLLFLWTGSAFAQATPPDAINYQGVLRDSSDEPLEGTYGMVFRFFSADSGGEEILVDAHGTVTVSGGLFNVQLGSGNETDGSGPGEYTTLSRVFADYPDLHLEVEVGGETLTPRVRVVSAGYALNTRYVRGVEIVSDGPLDLYVDSIIGDDNNDGLSPATAKQTIQAAVDAVPHLGVGPPTIHIADGTYHESVFIGPRSARAGIELLTLIGNESSPQSVVLDGQGNLKDGIFVAQGLAEIRGLEITGFLEEGIEVGLGFTIIENCRVIGNGSSGSDYAGVAFTRASGGDIANSIIANNVHNGVFVGDGGPDVNIVDCEIIDNGMHGIEVDRSAHLDGKGSLLIQGNGGIGVWAEYNSLVNFTSSPGLTIQSNTGGSMQAGYHSTIRGYGNGTTGSCAADTTSVCEP